MVHGRSSINFLYFFLLLSGTLKIYEKSGVYGGRCATKEFGGATFDYGAQFYALYPSSPIVTVHNQRWLPHRNKSLVKFWHVRDDNIERYASPYGMRFLVKGLQNSYNDLIVGSKVEEAKMISSDSNSVDVILNHRVTKLERIENQWRIHFDQIITNKDGNRSNEQSFVDSDFVVLTCPLPQVNIIIKNYDDGLMGSIYKDSFHFVLIAHTKMSYHIILIDIRYVFMTIFNLYRHLIYWCQVRTLYHLNVMHILGWKMSNMLLLSLSYTSQKMSQKIINSRICYKTQYMLMILMGYILLIQLHHH